MEEREVFMELKTKNNINARNYIENGKIDLAKKIIADTMGINIQDVLSLEHVGKKSRKAELTKKAMLDLFQTEQNEEMKTLTADIREICYNLINKAEINAELGTHELLLHRRWHKLSNLLCAFAI
jgi:hypothetical protein